MMSPKTCLLLLSLLILLTNTVNAQEITPPSPLPGNPEPEMPPKAHHQMIVGEAIFQATITELGTVESVEILKVPQAEMGFEARAWEAVKAWKFAPAREGDKPVPSTYTGSVMFSLRPEDEHAIVELVQRGVTAWNNGDLQAIANLFWPDAHFRSPRASVMVRRTHSPQSAEMVRREDRLGMALHEVCRLADRTSSLV